MVSRLHTPGAAPLPRRLPLVGIGCGTVNFTDERGDPSCRLQLLDGYLRALAYAGAACVVLPPQDAALAAQALAGCDALVLTGGTTDVPPAFYAQARRRGCGAVDMQRATFEAALLAEAWRRQLPTLGVCAGMQLINVWHGGSLVQDQSERPHALDHDPPQARHLTQHDLRLDPDSRLGEILSGSRERGGGLRVNSIHHQLVDVVASELRAVAWAPDGVVEAVEHPGAPFWMGVQWHPEAMDPSSGQWAVFVALAAAAGLGARRPMPAAAPPRAQRGGR